MTAPIFRKFSCRSSKCCQVLLKMHGQQGALFFGAQCATCEKLRNPLIAYVLL